MKNRKNYLILGRCFICYLTASSWFWWTDSLQIAQQNLGTAPLLVCQFVIHLKQRANKKYKCDQKKSQQTRFIKRRDKNASILWKSGVYSVRPGHEAPTYVFHCDTVYFWSTHLLQNLHCLLWVITQFTDHIHCNKPQRETQTENYGHTSKSWELNLP